MPVKNHPAVQKIALFAAREPIFLITLLLTVAVSFVSRPHASAIHWNVITTLFSLMLICHAFDRCQLLSSLAGAALTAFETPKKLGFAMIFATGVFSMLVTNDVALLTFVPLTMKMARTSGKDPFLLIILETMSANLFSALTPIGNPQNLFLYSYFHIGAGDFFLTMLPFCLAGAVLLVAINLLFNTGEAYHAQPQPFEIFDRRLLIGASVAFGINILCVLHVVDYRVSFVLTLLIVLGLAPRLIKSVDFCLLLTFVLFFLFTDSVTGIPAVKAFFSSLLGSRGSVLLLSAGLSQVISNVPAAVLLSGFTNQYRALLYGVSAGGLGTLVASLASLISYKYYIREYRPGRYLRVFSLLNFGALLLLLATTAAIGLWLG